MSKNILGLGLIIALGSMVASTFISQQKGVGKTPSVPRFRVYDQSPTTPIAPKTVPMLSPSSSIPAWVGDTTQTIPEDILNYVRRLVDKNVYPQMWYKKTPLELRLAWYRSYSLPFDQGGGIPTGISNYSV
jgi:hypothetical protein